MAQEIVLTQEQATNLNIRLEGAAIFKKSKLTAGETEDITASFYAEVETANEKAKVKVLADQKAKKDAEEKTRAMMMPSERQNKFVTARA